MKKKKSSHPRTTLEEALSMDYPDKELLKCPICRRVVRGSNMKHHLVNAHGGNATRRGSISKKDRQKIRKSGVQLSTEQLKQRTDHQKKVDQSAEGKAVLTDAHVPGSNLRKIDK